MNGIEFELVFEVTSDAIRTRMLTTDVQFLFNIGVFNNSSILNRSGACACLHSLEGVRDVDNCCHDHN